jgi:hypothetical protein
MVLRQEGVTANEAEDDDTDDDDDRWEEVEEDDDLEEGFEEEGEENDDFDEDESECEEEDECVEEEFDDEDEDDELAQERIDERFPDHFAEEEMTQTQNVRKSQLTFVPPPGETALTANRQPTPAICTNCTHKGNAAACNSCSKRAEPPQAKYSPEGFRLTPVFLPGER